MRTVVRNALLSVAVAATTLAAMPMAQAGDRWNHGHRYHHRDRGGQALAAGALGLVAGALIAGAANSRPQYEVIEPGYDPYYRPDPYYARPVYAPPPRPVHVYREPAYREPVYRQVGGYEPWSREWFNWCQTRYRSFDANTGTFRGYDGRDHFCVAN